MLRSIFSQKSIAVLTIIAAIFLISRVNNPRNARTGAPNEGTCADEGCHVGIHHLDGTIDISGLPDVIETDSTYRLKILMNNPGGTAAKGGFQLATLDANNDSIGVFTNIDLSSTITKVSNRVYWEHNPSKNFDLENNVEFLCDWKAPSEVGDGMVKLYCSAVISNGNRGASADLVLNVVDSFSIQVGRPNLKAEFVDKVHVDCYGENNGKLSLQVSGGLPPYSYKWNHGGTDSTFNNLTDAIYRVTVTDHKLDSVKLRTRIFQPDSLAINPRITHVSCPGESDGEVNILVSGGVGPYSYEWPGGINTNPRTTLISGFYEVTITDDSGCSKVINISVNQPVFFVLSNDFVQENVSCFGYNDGSIDLGPGISNAISYTYRWNTGATTESVSNLGAGRYFVTISDETLCEEWYSFDISQSDQLAGNLTNTEISIRGGSNGTIQSNVTGGNRPYDYIWSNGQTSSSIRGLSAGNYSLTVTDASECTSIFSLMLEEPDCNIQVIEELTSVSCFGECDGIICPSVSIADFPVSYQWSNGATDSCISFLCNGSYFLTITDQQGCDISMSFEIEEPSQLSSVSIVTDNLCLGERQGELEYRVSGGTPPYNISPANMNNLSNGIYSFTISDVNNCSIVVSDVISSPEEITIAVESIIEPSMDDSNGSIDITSSGGIRPFIYFWVDQDGFSVSNQEDLLDVPNGCYTLTIIDANGCDFKADKMCIGPVGVNEELAKSFRIHPNPFRDYVNIESRKSVRNAYLRVYSSDGNLIEERINNSFYNNTKLNTSQWSKGIYFIEVSTENGHFAKKLVKLD